MNAFVVCSRVTLSTAVATFTAMIVFCVLWTAAMFMGLTQVTIATHAGAAALACLAAWLCLRFIRRPTPAEEAVST